MPDKEFKTVDEQIEILESRGLQIPDKEIARDFLYRNNYYRISGYSLTLRDHDVFAPSAAFQNIIDIYEFDHELRHILLKYIEIIEVSVKSAYCHEFAKVYGATGYLVEAHFSDKKKYNEIMVKAQAQIKSRLPHEAYLKHFVIDLQQDIPIWAFVDILTIADISFLYKSSPEKIKVAVANALGLKTRGAELLEQFTHYMTIIRNLCAHGSRLFNRLFEQKPRLSKNERKLLILSPDGSVDNAHLYGFILIMRRLLKTCDFSAMKAEIMALTEKNPFVNMKHYGFRDDWKIML